MKKIISFLLALLLTVFTAFSALAADGQWEKASIVVNYFGNRTAAQVLTNKNHEILVPVSWISYYGSMKVEEQEECYKFYYPLQEDVKYFAKFIYIEKDGSTFDIRYSMEKNSFLEELAVGKKWWSDTVEAVRTQGVTPETYETLKTVWNVAKKELSKFKSDEYNSFSVCSGKFSEQVVYEDSLYLPMEEVLPFLSAKVGFSQSGEVLIHPNSISLSQALAEIQLGDLAFDAYTDIAYTDALTGTAYVVDTLVNFNYNRLLFSKVAQVEEYEQLFKSYLIEDETYLSAFDKEVTPQAELYNLVADAFAEGESALKIKGGSYQYLEELQIPKELYGDDYEVLYKDFDNTKIKGMDIVEGFSKFFDYYRTYNNQVEDHRKMLSAVYSCQGDMSMPQNIAAFNTEQMYNQSVVSSLTTGAAKAIRDVASNVLQETAKGLVKPYSIASAVTKRILPKEYKVVADTALILHMDANVSTAFDAYLHYKYGEDYTAQAMNNMRLSAIMTLVASKHAYQTIWGKGHEKIKEIDKALTKLYLAADGVECDSSDYYQNKKEELKKSFAQLQPQTNELVITGVQAEAVQYIYNKDTIYNVFLYKQNGKYGVIDANGNVMHSAQYEDVNWHFHYSGTGNLLFLDDGGVQDPANPHNNFTGYFVEQNGELKKGVRDVGYGDEYFPDRIYWHSTGNRVILVPGLFRPEEKIQTYSFEEYNRRNGATEKKLKFIHSINNWQISSSFAGWKSFLPVYDSDKYAAFDCETGKIVTDFIYDSCCVLSDDLAFVQLNDQWRLLNRKGEYVDEKIYDEPESDDTFVYRSLQQINGYCIIKVSGLYGLCDSTGKTIVEPTWENISNVSPQGRYWRQEQDGTWSLIQLAIVPSL